MDMIHGPTPPTAQEMRRFDAIWGETSHRNVCVRLRDGRATIRVSGLPDFEFYYAPEGVTVDATEDANGIELEERESRAPGTVCLGIVEEGAPK